MGLWQRLRGIDRRITHSYLRTVHIEDPSLRDWWHGLPREDQVAIGQAVWSVRRSPPTPRDSAVWAAVADAQLARLVSLAHWYALAVVAVILALFGSGLAWWDGPDIVVVTPVLAPVAAYLVRLAIVSRRRADLGRTHSTESRPDESTDSSASTATSGSPPV